jgi:bifunctional non-homologous end joining protein LigD
MALIPPEVREAEKLLAGCMPALPGALLVQLTDPAGAFLHRTRHINNLGQIPKGGLPDLGQRHRVAFVAPPAHKDVRLVSRNQKAFDYPQLLDALKLLPAGCFILDGEIAGLDEKGRSSFQLLQIFKSSGNVPLVYFAFDLLFLDGKDLREQRLSASRKLLAKLLEKAPENIRFSGELRGSKDELLRVAEEFGLEGLVAKRPNSLYESGRRSGAWVKFKITKSQEFVIGGYTLPEGSRSYFGSLLVGYQSPDGLMFAGRVGTGFSEKLLANLYGKLQKLKQPDCPFVNLPEKSKGR